MEIRAFYIKSLVNAEVDFQHLTSDEQIEMIKKLIKDHYISYPDDEKIIMIINKELEYDNELDW